VQNDRNPEAYAGWARWTYDRFRLLKPGVSTDGLWELDGAYCIVCPDIASSSELEKLATWFKECCCPVTAPVDICLAPPQGAHRVSSLSPEERASLTGMPLTWNEFVLALAAALPRSFPEYSLKYDPPLVTFLIQGSLAPREREALGQVMDGFASPMEWRVEVATNARCEPANRRSYRRKQGDVALLPARLQPRQLGRKATRLWEEDEDFWNRTRKALLSGLDMPDGTFVKSLVRPSSRCLVNGSVFPPGNIRTYLTLFEKVILVAPLADSHRTVLQSLALSDPELIELAARGRVLCVFPQSIERYNPGFVSALAERAPEAMIFSRRLAAETISELRSRLPFVFWPLTTEERLEILRLPGLVRAQSPLVKGLAAVSDELVSIWRDLEWNLTLNGALATGFMGMGRVVAALIRAMTGIDKTLELTSAAASVEWGAALGAVIIPCSGPDYSEQESSEFLAALYSGVPDTEIDVGVTDVQELGLGLLGIEGDAPVLELAEALSCVESSRVISIARRLYAQAGDQGDVARLVNEHNLRVRQFEKRKRKLHKTTLSLVVPAAAAARLTGADCGPLPDIITLGAYVLDGLLSIENSVLGQLGDRIGAAILRSSPDVVLTSRIRRRLRA